MKKKTTIGNYTLPADVLAKANMFRPCKIKKAGSFQQLLFMRPILVPIRLKKKRITVALADRLITRIEKK